MRRYLASDTLDLDLVVSSEFSKDERATLHQAAQRAGPQSRSYGADKDRFLVVKKKLDPFSLARAVIEKGGVTPKYKVFIPSDLQWER
ncbi:NF-kappa-B-repressing factor-like isoform X1 [Ostrinia nubilalis]|uniref:NF-kappa-B-repressing factor-like isoform X1 n=1 Tax=Ostrinia nubilalis TaxID=29057 RepID=UPI003082380B